jgi:ubiquinone biosynthesis protein COQ4
MSIVDPPSARALTGLEGFLTLANDPTQIRAFYDLHKGLEDTPAMLSFEQTMLAVPEIAQMVDEGYEPPPLPLAELSRMPEGSLGRVYAERMLADGLDPDVIRRNAASKALEPGESELARKARYLTRRRTMTHDIHHTVTGFATDLPGEVGISAVYLAQIHQPVSLLYLCAVLLHTMPEPELYGRALHRLQEGLQMGWKAGNLLAQKWELGWERPLADWREQLAIVPARA